MVGNIENIVETLKAGMARGYRIEESEYGYVTLVIGDDAELQERKAAFRARTADMSSHDRNEALCREQVRGWGLNPFPYDYALSKNFYGYAMGSMIKANLRGGRFSEIRRGATLEEAVKAGVSRTETRNVTFRITLCVRGSARRDTWLPEEVVTRLGLDVA